MTRFGLFIAFDDNLALYPCPLRRTKALCDEAFLKIKHSLEPGPTISLKNTGKAGNCPICMDTIEDQPRDCDHCETRYHSECWDGIGGCAVFGCQGMYQRRSRNRVKT